MKKYLNKKRDEGVQFFLVVSYFVFESITYR
jgi:hypothetical protein